MCMCCSKYSVSVSIPLILSTRERWGENAKYDVKATAIVVLVVFVS